MPWHKKIDNNHQGRAFYSKDYNTSRWRKYRKYFLMQHPICVDCKKNGQLVPSSVVDHIIPVSCGGNFWDKSNHQALCLSCHQSKSAKEKHQ